MLTGSDGGRLILRYDPTVEEKARRHCRDVGGNSQYLKCLRVLGPLWQQQQARPRLAEAVQVAGKDYGLLPGLNFEKRPPHAAFWEIRNGSYRVLMSGRPLRQIGLS